MKIKEILDYLDGNNENYLFIGDENTEINRFSSLNYYKSGSMTWIKNKEGLSKKNTLEVRELNLAIIQKGIALQDTPKNYIVIDESKRIFFEILEHFYGDEKTKDKIGEGTYISPKVKIGDNVIIGCNCTIDGEISIGDNTTIFNNVNIINDVTIGENCEIQSGVSIGHNGFGYTENNNKKSIIKHYGGVSIGKDVFIGANTCIARGTIDNTVIGDDCKIDTLCHIAHNAILGKSVTLITGSLIYGSVTIENNGYIASGIIKNQLTVEANSIVGMGSVVTKDIEANSTVVGVPAKRIK